MVIRPPRPAPRRAPASVARGPVLVLALVLALAPGGRAHAAGNMDLSTVPPRDTVELTIYNSEDLTLVRESRVLTLRRGSNTLQFGWRAP